jgi:hypothetical protein
MSNYLKMPKKTQVLALLELGWSYRRIEAEWRADSSERSRNRLRCLWIISGCRTLLLAAFG